MFLDGTSPCKVTLFDVHCVQGARAELASADIADILTTAAVSNWGCTAICAAIARRTGGKRLIRPSEMEARLLEVISADGLINPADGLIDLHVDDIKDTTHIALTEMAEAITRKALS